MEYFLLSGTVSRAFKLHGLGEIFQLSLEVQGFIACICSFNGFEIKIILHIHAFNLFLLSEKMQVTAPFPAH